MATHMTNTVEGIVSFRDPIVVQVHRVDSGQTGLTLAKAVKAVWTTNATGTDGKMTVNAILPVNEDQWVTLPAAITLDTVTLGNNPNILAVQ